MHSRSWGFGFITSLVVNVLHARHGEREMGSRRNC